MMLRLRLKGFLSERLSALFARRRRMLTPQEQDAADIAWMIEELPPANRIQSGMIQVDTPFKLARWLYPREHCPHPDAEPISDVIVHDVVVCLSMRDRFRLLVSGRLAVDSKIVTEHRPGVVQGLSVAYPLPPKWLERKDKL